MRNRVKRTAMLLEIAASTPEHLKVFQHTLKIGGAAKTLYTQAHALGYHWDVDQRQWYTGPRRGNRVPPHKRPAPNGTTQRIGVKTVSDKIVVRVLAHHKVIKQAVADLIELAEAMNMQILSVSEPTADEGMDAFSKVYIRIKKQYETE